MYLHNNDGMEHVWKKCQLVATFRNTTPFAASCYQFTTAGVNVYNDPVLDFQQSKNEKSWRTVCLCKIFLQTQ